MSKTQAASPFKGGEPAVHHERAVRALERLGTLCYHVAKPMKECGCQETVFTNSLVGTKTGGRPGTDVMEALADIMMQRGCPEYIRSDNGPEFIAKKLREWLSSLGVITTYIEPGSPWENGYCESFNSRMRDEFLNGELFGNLYEAEVLARRWKDYYNTVRPHGSLGGRPPAPQSILLTA